MQATAIALLRRLLAVPPTHDVVLLSGSARAQFAMFPMNLLKSGTVGDYAITGHWARAAYDEGALVGGPVHVSVDTREPDGFNYRRVPGPVGAHARSARDCLRAHLQ